MLDGDKPADGASSEGSAPADPKKGTVDLVLKLSRPKWGADRRATIRPLGAKMPAMSGSSIGPPRSVAPTLLEEDMSRALAQRGARDRGVLTQVDGTDVGRVASLEGDLVTLGRAPECTHRFDIPSLSRVHARLLRQGGEWALEDAGSRNGCLLNDQKVTRATLRDGDRIGLGTSVTLRFRLVDVEEERGLKALYESSVRDGLTGAFNRKHLEERLSAELSYAKRHGTPLAIVMCDLDHFKRVNDTHGHLAGDHVLRTTAGLLRQTLRNEDMLARYGGEEFVVVARGVALPNATLLAERLRGAVAAARIEYEGSAIPVTLSAGVATIACCGGPPSPEALLALADDRLYRAKESGRNRVVAS